MSWSLYFFCHGCYFTKRIKPVLIGRHSLPMHFEWHTFLLLSLALFSFLPLSHHLVTICWHLEQECKCIFFLCVWRVWARNNERIKKGNPHNKIHGLLLSTIMASLVLSFLPWNHLQWRRAELDSQSDSSRIAVSRQPTCHRQTVARREETVSRQLKRVRERPTDFLRCLSAYPFSLQFWGQSGPLTGSSPPGPVTIAPGPPRLVFHCNTWKSALCTS